MAILYNNVEKPFLQYPTCPRHDYLVFKPSTAVEEQYCQSELQKWCLVHTVNSHYTGFFFLFFLSHITSCLLRSKPLKSGINNVIMYIHGSITFRATGMNLNVSIYVINCDLPFL